MDGYAVGTVLIECAIHSNVKSETCLVHIDDKKTDFDWILSHLIIILIDLLFLRVNLEIITKPQERYIL